MGPATTSREAVSSRRDSRPSRLQAAGVLAARAVIPRHEGIRATFVLVVAVLLLGLLILAAPRVRRFLAIDSCLDAGGKWEKEECVGARWPQ